MEIKEVIEAIEESKHAIASINIELNPLKVEYRIAHKKLSNYYSLLEAYQELCDHMYVKRVVHGINYETCELCTKELLI